MVARARRTAGGRTALPAVTAAVATVAAVCAGCAGPEPDGGPATTSAPAFAAVTTTGPTPAVTGTTQAPAGRAGPGSGTGSGTGSGPGSSTGPAPVLTRSGPEPGRGPVVIIPGYGGQTALLRPLIDALRAEGRTVHVVSGLGDATARLQRQADIAGRQIDRLLADGAASVDVIGFSQGGLVARLWARDGGQARARRVVTLGAPHHGSRVAELADRLFPDECPAACRQLVPGSAFLDGLGDSAPGPGWTSIWTRSDRISTPARTAILPGAVSFAVQDVCPDVPVSHAALPRTRFVVDLVVQALDAPEPLVSGPRRVASGCPPPP